jgi:ubiquinone/menaquinone biosynthesis C-methylase UbiE
MELMADPRGMAVLDVACGEGFYTRMIRQHGAARVTGVDLSSGMIDLARRQESQHQLGIDYIVGDARELSGMEPFDLAVAAYLLNYAHNRDELQAMCDGIARSLREGGRFLTVNCNPALNFPGAPSYRKYGFETTVVGDWREELILTKNGELRIATTTVPSASRHVTLMQDALYRNDVAHASMGYFYPPNTSAPLFPEVFKR